MDRRENQRIVATSPVKLRVLGATDREVDALLQDISEHGASLTCEDPLALGTAIRLELADNLYLGEVVHCQPAGDGFRAGLRFQQCLGRVSDLRKLVAGLMGASRQSTPTAA